MTSGREKTRQELIDELHRLAGKLGHTPRIKDIKEEGRYSYSPYRNKFGSWNEALRDADFEPNKTSREISREALIEELLRLAEKLEKSPGKREMDEVGKYSYTAYRNEFGTWNEALLEAGLEPNTKEIPREDLLQALEDLAENLERIPRANDMRHKGRHSPTAYRNEFGGWNDALRAAGFRLNLEYDIDDMKLLAEIDRLADEVPPTSEEMREKGDYCISTYVRAFGSWNNALREAGYEPHVERETDRDEGNGGRKVDGRDRYGSNWKKKSYDIRDSDGECLICGKTQSDLEKYNESLQVHHITTDDRLRENGRENRDDEEETKPRPAKLVTLCPEHHDEWEGMLGPDVRRDGDGDSGEDE
jgi:DNA-binding protein H-NS